MAIKYNKHLYLNHTAITTYFYWLEHECIICRLSIIVISSCNGHFIYGTPTIVSICRSILNQTQRDNHGLPKYPEINITYELVSNQSCRCITTICIEGLRVVELLVYFMRRPRYFVFRPWFRSAWKKTATSCVSNIVFRRILPRIPSLKETWG